MPARRFLWSIVLLVVLFMFLASSGVELMVDYLWLDTIGYRQVFLTIFGTRLALGLAGFAVAFLWLWLNMAYALRQVGDPAQFLPAELTLTPLGQFLTASKSTKRSIKSRSGLMLSGLKS